MNDTATAPVTDEALRQEVRDWLKANWTGSLMGQDANNAWLARVVGARWAVPHWPVEWMGRSLGDTQARIIDRDIPFRQVRSERA